jgi:chemotaxis protein CheX
MSQTFEASLSGDPAQDISPDELNEALGEVLASLGLESFPIDPAAVGELGVSGSVTISGEWNGAVQMELTDSSQRGTAAAMFMLDPDVLSEEEIVDAVGELVNMVGGGIKGMLPEPSRLSLPTVVQGHDLHLSFPGMSPVIRYGRASETGPITVTVWAESPGS